MKSKTPLIIVLLFAFGCLFIADQATKHPFKAKFVRRHLAKEAAPVVVESDGQILYSALPPVSDAPIKSEGLAVIDHAEGL